MDTITHSVGMPLEGLLITIGIVSIVFIILGIILFKLKSGENKKPVKRKVVCVYGKFDNKSDFVLEPATGKEKELKPFWIQEA